jgi:small subunit ribosomal protein S9
MAKNQEVQDIIGVGRRKTAVSSVRMRRGKGKIDVNGRKFNEYFLSDIQRNTILEPFEKFSDLKKYDLIIRIKGGGVEAQSIATRLGISRALVQQNEELRSQLKDLGYLTRDPRKKERKKYGLAGARKRFQFSKR